MANDVANWGQFVPTTTILDVALLYEVDVKSPEFIELLVRLYQTVNNTAISTNIKDTGYYLTKEFNVGSLLFDVNNDFNRLRPIYRTTVDFGALPAAGSKSVAHGIPNITVAGTTTFSFLKIYGAATNPTTVNFIPLPFVSAGATNNDNLQVEVDTTNVIITTGGKDYSAWTTSYIILEYVKQ